jgi:hypothetical protein
VLPTSASSFAIVDTAVTAQGTTMMGMFLVFVKPFNSAFKVLVVLQLAASTTVLLTVVAETIKLGVAS